MRRLALFGLLLAACTAARADDATSNDEAAIESVDSSLGEQLEPNETQLVSDISAAATQQVIASQATDPNHVARRDAHPKAHGCVTGSFTVNPDVPADLRGTTFTPGAHYDTWVRFSNGSQADDTQNDARGMAIKLIGVPGARLLTGEAPGTNTHDIILSNHHTFFISNLSDYVGFMNAVTQKGNPMSFFLSWNPFDLHLRAAYLAHEFTTQPISSPITSRYWSVTPYALGDKAVKYTATPCGGADTSGTHANEPNYLAAALKDGLASGDGACFDFAIQRRGDPDDYPVEDSTQTWSEDDSPYVNVARITIPAQTFDSAEQTKFCENLSFTPWHATTDHRPLGSLNRTRKVVYEATSATRHRLNAAPRVEPTDLTVR